MGHQNELLDVAIWQAPAQFFQGEWFIGAWMYVDVQRHTETKKILSSTQYARSRVRESRHAIMRRAFHVLDDLRLFSHYLATSSWTMLLSSFRDWALWRYVVATEEPSTFPRISSISNDRLPDEVEIRKAWERGTSDPSYVADLARRDSLYDVHYSHAMLVRPFRTEQGYLGLGTQCLRRDGSV